MKPNHDFAVSWFSSGIIRRTFLFPVEMTKGSLLMLEEFTVKSKGQGDLILSPKNEDQEGPMQADNPWLVCELPN